MPRALTTPESKCLADLLKLGSQTAKKPLVFGHLRLAFSLAARHAARAPYMAQDLASVALVALVEAVDLAATRLKDRNIGAYIHVIVRYALIDALYNVPLISIPKSTKKLHNLTPPKVLTIEEQITDDDEAIRKKGGGKRRVSRAPRSGVLIEFREAIGLACESAVDLEIIRLRGMGYKDVEIAGMVDYTPARVGQLRKAIKQRFNAFYYEAGDEK